MEKLLIMSNFSFCHSVFKFLLLQWRQKASICGKGFKSGTFPNFENIYIPGDNDIGGEGRDLITQRKVNKFQHHFGNITDIIKFSFIDYIKVSLQWCLSC